MNIKHMARLAIAHAHLDTPDLRPAQRIAEHSGTWDWLNRHQWASEEEEWCHAVWCTVTLYTRALREER